MQWIWNLGWNEAVPVLGNATVQVGIYKRYSFNFGKDQTGCAAIHSGELDLRPLARSTLFVHEIFRRLPAGDFLANNRAQYFLLEAHFRSATRAQPQPFQTHHHRLDRRTVHEVTISLISDNSVLHVISTGNITPM